MLATGFFKPDDLSLSYTLSCSFFYTFYNAVKKTDYSFHDLPQPKFVLHQRFDSLQFAILMLAIFMLLTIL